MVASMPTITTRCALATNPMATPTWTDISDYLQAFSCRRGRQQELGIFESGHATAVLKNQDRRFDPLYTAGPYYGNLKRMRKFDLRVTWNSVVYDVFSGYVEKWPQTWEATGRVARVPVPLVDGFAVLALAKLNATYSQELSGVRVNNVLDDINWGTGQGWILDSASYSLLGTTTILAPVGDRTVEQGASTIQAQTLSDTAALTHLQDVEKTEGGRLFMSKDGSVVFQSRHRPLQPPYSASLYTFGDSTGELPYAGLELDDDTVIYNDVRMQRTGGTVQTASDSTSQDNYFVRTLQETALLAITDTEMLDRANWMVYSYKQPGTRIRSMTLKPQRDPTNLWPAVLSLEIGDRITVKRRPPGGGDAINQDCIIEGIAHNIARSDYWETQLWLSPAPADGVWLLNDATYSVLGTSTRLGYALLPLLFIAHLILNAFSMFSWAAQL